MTELDRQGASPQLWRAPTAESPVDATVELPGSKSITNRALPLAALANSPSVVRGALRSRDTDLMVAGLRALGIGVDDAGPDWSVTPAPLRGAAEIDCGLAGTVARFLLAVAALADGTVHFDGDPHLRRRPMRPLIDGLRQLGVHIDDGERGAFPLSVSGTGRISGGECAIDASTSSQFISALLLVSSRADDPVVVRHRGPTLPSLPHIEMTVSMLRERGVKVDDSTPHEWRVSPGPIHGEPSFHMVILAPGLEPKWFFETARPYWNTFRPIVTTIWDFINYIPHDRSLAVTVIAPFDMATMALARVAATLTKAGHLISVAGGGDTVSALNLAEVADDFTYVSTAGGAFLEWMEGKTLPGVTALMG